MTNINRRGEEAKAGDGEDGQEGQVNDQESTESPAAEEVHTTTTTTGSPRRQSHRLTHVHTEHGRGRERVPSTHSFSRSSLPLSSNRRHFDWHSVTAPPPPISPLSRPNPPAVSSRFTSPLHRSSPLHRDHDFNPQAPPAGNVYPLQHSHIPHQGVGSGRGAPQVYRCSGPEKEFRRCFSQVQPSPLNHRNIRHVALHLQASQPLKNLSSSLQQAERPLFIQPAAIYSLQSCLIYMCAMYWREQLSSH